MDEITSAPDATEAQYRGRGRPRKGEIVEPRPPKEKKERAVIVPTEKPRPQWMTKSTYPQTAQEMFGRAVQYFQSNDTYSMSGLRLHLGYSNAMTFSRHMNAGNEISEVLNWAHANVMKYYEEMGQSARNPVFSIFVLKAMGMKDGDEIGSANNPVHHVSIPPIQWVKPKE